MRFEDLGLPPLRWVKASQISEVYTRSLDGKGEYLASIGYSALGGFFCHIVGSKMHYFDSLHEARKFAERACDSEV